MLDLRVNETRLQKFDLFEEFHLLDFAISRDGGGRFLGLLKKENYHNLEVALDSLSDEEYQLIEMLYLCENPLSLRQVAECFDVSVSTIYKRKEKILEKMRKFW